jgi:signal transduction histidine kinase/CheY-like chemotaxis protein
MAPLTLIVELLFGAVFIAALVRLVRGRDPLAGDVTLVFSGLAAVLVAGLIEPIAGPLGDAVGLVGLVLLLAQPLFTLRLVGRLRDLPRWLLPAAFGALVLTTAPLLVLNLTDRESARSAPVLVALVTAFVVVELVAAGYLAIEARRRVGSARIRLALAALATAGLAVAILAAGTASAMRAQGSGDGDSAIVTQLIALLSAVGYVVAFLPPRWLRRLWQAEAAYRYRQELLSAPATDDEPTLWRRLAASAARVAGSDAVAILVTAPDGSARLAATAGPRADQIGPVVATPEATEQLFAENGVFARVDPGRVPLIDELGGSLGARYASVVAFQVDANRRAILVHLSRYASLFGADDTALLGALAQIAALLVERRSVLAEQEELASQLTATVGALRAASEAKSDFVASMSHELRTPLTAIIGFSDLMRTTKRDGDMLEVPAEWVEHIHRSGQHLLGLINDVLDLAKVEAGRLDLTIERLDLGAAVLESVSGLRPLADRKSVTIITEVPSMEVDVDRGRLRQIVYNLLSNAIKYTPEGGRITVDAARENGSFRLAVSDTGVGISEDDLLHVFEEFRQVGDVATRQPGTGLGLALTRRLVETHGGRIEAESTPGSGSRFTVHLPMTREPSDIVATEARLRRATETAPIAAPDGATTRPQVLVIEDDPGAVRLLRAILETDGYDMRVAQDGESGIDSARATRPRAIILDVLLSGIDGWEVLRRLKSDEDLRDVPVIIVTIVDERDLGLALGAVDYLVKPVDRAALRASLARYTSGANRPGGIRVLAVDDDPATLDMIEGALRPDGHEVTRALSGEAGLAIARSSPLDLVICDILMPDLDGFGVVAALNQDHRTRDLPILILTAHELSDADRSRLNGKIVGVAAKGETGKDGLLTWLRRAVGATTTVQGSGQA